jgi:conjugative transfer region lipoprotein (TIGR03751 family)
MYVYPHLSRQDEAPVPGYSTAFELYEKAHYALPGEL